MSVFRGSKNFYDYEVSDILGHNIRTWLDYGFLEMGAYTNVTFNNPNTSGFTNLKRVYDDRADAGTVWEGMGPAWVWESGVSVLGNQAAPFQVSGVYVNNTFYPVSTSGQRSYTVDYKNGRIVFASGLAAGTSVKCEYSFKDIGVYLVDSPQWKTIVDRYDEQYNNLETLSPSGMASILKINRVWLPSVFVEVQERNNQGYQLGGGELAIQTVRYHILTNRAFDNHRISDTINNQYQKKLSLYDINLAPFPLNFNGSIASGAKTYPQLADQNSPYYWTAAFIEDSFGGPEETLSDVYRSELTHSVVVYRYVPTY
jgi:hypothetical protein